MCVSYSTDKLTYADVNAVLGSADFYKIAEAVRLLLSDDSGGALSCAEEIFAGGKSAGVFVKDILGYLNNLAVAKMCKNAEQILNLPQEMFSVISSVAAVCDGHKLLRATEIFVKAEGDMRYAADPRVVLETAILRCTLPQADYNIDSLIARVSALEKKIAEGNFAPAAPAAASTRAPAQNMQTEQPQPSRSFSGGEVQTDFLHTGGGRATAFYAPEKSKEIKPEAKTAPDELSSDPFSSKQAKPAPAQAAAPSKGRGSVLATLLRALRTTHKNAVLFTLCSDLGCEQDGGKVTFTTDNETVHRAITRQDNAKILSDILAESGITEYEVKLLKKDDALSRALDVLKSNFGGTDINIK